MTVVSDYTAILGYLDGEERRWNATEDLGFPVFVSYSFVSADRLPALGDLDYPAATVQVMSAAQEAAVRAALAQFEAVAGLKFVETTGEAMINAHAVTGSSYGGWAHYPYVTDLSSSTGDYVIDVSRGDKVSGDGIGTLLHEIGHAVGLSHTHGGNLTLSAAMDSRSQTVMSYNWSSTPTDTLGPLDVQAVRHIYGAAADMTGWTYGFSGDAFKVTGGSNDDRIMGVQGRNVLKGEHGNDILIGRDGNDKLIGGYGDDTLLGMGGADRLIGGWGDDLLQSSVQDDINYLDPGTHTLIGGRGRDRLLGGDGDDVMRGGRHSDTLKGGHGNDTLEGGKGLDLLTGGTGADVFRFHPAIDGQRDTVLDFVYYSDRLDLGAANLSRDDLTVTSAARPANTLLKIDDGAGIDFEIRFKGIPVSDLNAYLANYHDFG